MESVARVRHIGDTYVPQGAVVLYAIEHIEVFRLHGSQTNGGSIVGRGGHFIVSFGVIIILLRPLYVPIRMFRWRFPSIRASIVL